MMLVCIIINLTPTTPHHTTCTSRAALYLARRALETRVDTVDLVPFVVLPPGDEAWMEDRLAAVRQCMGACSFLDRLGEERPCWLVAEFVPTFHIQTRAAPRCCPSGSWWSRSGTRTGRWRRCW